MFEVPSEVNGPSARLLITNGPEKVGSNMTSKQIQLEPFEGRIYLLDTK